MKTLIKIIGIVAIANLICFWIAYGLLISAWPDIGLGQVLGIEQAPPPSHWLTILMWNFIILAAPTSAFLDGTGGDHFLLIFALSSLLNCVIWGVCLGYPIYAIGKRFQNAKAQ